MERLPNVPIEKNIRRLKLMEELERKRGNNYVIYRNMRMNLERIYKLLQSKIDKDNYHIRSDIWNHYLLLMKKASKLKGMDEWKQNSSNSKRHQRI